MKITIASRRDSKLKKVLFFKLQHAHMHLSVFVRVRACVRACERERERDA